MWARRTRRAAAWTIACSALACGATASPAGAWTATLDGTTLHVDAAAGEPNAFAISDGEAATVAVFDFANAATSVPAACTLAEDGELDCPRAAVTQVVVAAGDAADEVTLATTLPSTALGGDGDDLLFGSSAGDVLAGESGDDLLIGDGGADRLTGGDGTDQLDGGTGADELDGAAGADTLDGGDDADALSGGDGADILGGGPADDVLDGGAGTDQLSGDPGSDALSGGADDDTLDGGDDADALHGGDGADDLDGGDGTDQILGDGGDDTIAAQAGDDWLDGGAGSDAVTGGPGNEQILGGPGNDALEGGAGADALHGGEGDDRLDGGEGPDLLAGNDGRDVAAYDGRIDSVTVTLDGAANDGELGEGDNALGDVEQLDGGGGDDTLAAAATGTTLHGGDGNDTLVGAAGADALDGEAGDDVLDGGAGPDAIVGGSEFDTVTYASRLAGVAVTLGGPAGDDGQAGEGDTVGADVENVVGGGGPDRLTGARDVPNVLSAGGGADVLFARDQDAAPDQVQCGGGTDRAELDGLDDYAADCENVLLDGSQVAFSPAAEILPRMFIMSSAVRVGTEGVAVVRVRCSAATVGRCAGRITLAVNSTRKQQGKATFRILPGASSGVRVRISSARMRRLRRVHPRGVVLRAAVVVNDVLGRSSTVAKRVRLRYRRGR